MHEFGRKIAIGMIRVYQGATATRLPVCRFTPTCSHYGVEAIQVHGVLKGSWLTLRRIGRCRPRGGFGYDPVPAPRVTSPNAALAEEG